VVNSIDTASYNTRTQAWKSSVISGKAKTEVDADAGDREDAFVDADAAPGPDAERIHALPSCSPAQVNPQARGALTENRVCGTLDVPQTCHFRQ